MSESWKNKFPLGSQWETRGGWRAVVVDHRKSDLIVWHSKYHEDKAHWIDGRYFSNGTDYANDLIGPWKEPRTGEFWVNVFSDEGDYGKVHATKQDADESIIANDRIACVHVKWVEGEGMEDSE